MPNSTNFPERLPKVGGTHSETIVWRARKELIRFVGSQCKKCGKKQFPRRWVCAYCGARDLEDVELSPGGTIYTYSIGAFPGEDVTGNEDMRQQIFAMIQLDDGPLIEAEIVDFPLGLVRPWILQPEPPPEGYWFFDFLRGKRVRLTIRRTRRLDNGNLTYGFKFRLEDPPWGKMANVSDRQLLIRLKRLYERTKTT